MSFSGDSDPKKFVHFVEFFPVANERYQNANSNFQSFCVKLHFVEGFNAEALKDAEHFHLEAILYDQTYHRFVGNKWQGTTVTLKYDKLSRNQVIFFYTSIDIRELLLVVEVVVKLKEWNTDKVLEWSVISLTEVQEHTVSSHKFTQTRVSLYYGSPISLLFMNWTPERQSSLENAKAGEIAYTVMSHPVLMRIVHLLPENIIVSNANEVPGLVPAGKGGDNLLKPQLQKTVTYVLEQVAIKVIPALSSVETEMMNKLLEERNSNDTSPLRFTEAAIVQRQLQVGVHNGLCYIQEPDFYHLLVEPVITAAFNRTSDGDKESSITSSPSIFSRNECLTLRSDVKIPYVPCDPNVMLIFIVEYGISFKDSTASTSSLTKNPTSTVPILWGFCKLSELKGKSQVSVCLTSDPTSCPSHTLFMKMLSSQKFELTFSASHLSRKREDTSMTSLHYSPVRQVDHGSYSTTGEKISSGNASPSHQEQQLLPQHQTPPKKSPRSFFHSPVQNATKQAPSSYTASEIAIEYEEKNTALQEITVIPTSLPIIPVTVHSISSEHNLPRKVYSKIYSAGFPTVYDHNGRVPSVIDPCLPYNVDVNKELSHLPHGNEIVFEFLALSEIFHMQADIPRTVFFTFHFYRFPPVRTEKLVFEPVETDHRSPSLFHIIHTLHADDKRRSQPGYTVSYHIDPCDLCPGEYNAFVEFLVNSTIHIDMWDGNSFLYLGTASAPLKYFCHQGKDAVTSTLDLNFVTAEYLDDSVSQTASTTRIITGNLHLRVTSVKVPLSSKSLAKLEGMKIADSPVVHSRSENNSSFTKTSTLVTKAKPLVETSRELGALLSSRTLHGSGSHLPSSGLSEERRRKLSRMEAVRSINDQNRNQSTYSVAKDMRNLIKERQRDLMIVESYVEKNKADIIHSFLQKSITTEKRIFPVLGSSSFFEFELINPFPSEQNVTILWQCPNLSLVLDTEEWQFLREVFHMDKNVENHLIAMSERTPPAVYLKGKEKVCIPFKYQCVPTSDVNCEYWLASSGHNFTSALMNSAPPPEYLSLSHVKVHFSSNEQTLTDVLVLIVQPVPPLVTKVFRLLAPEHSLFKKAIRLPCKGKSRHLQIKCTDVEVVYEVVSPSEVKDHVDINLKAPTGSSGTCRTFYIFIYEDKFCFKPSQTLSISVHSLQRIDVSCTTGQMNKSSVLIRGDYSTRLVQCFSSSTELELHPSEAFVLSACSIQELSVNIMPLLPGIRYFCLAMVDQEPQKLLKSWLLVISCPKPSISKAFQVHLVIGKEATKRITFTNNFCHERHYIVHCSNPHLVHMKDLQFCIAGKESYALGIYFPPQRSYLSENVFIYINSSDDKNEETYCIKVVCK